MRLHFEFTRADLAMVGEQYSHCPPYAHYCLQGKQSQEIRVDIYRTIQHILDMNTNPTHHQNIIITIP